MSTGLSCEFVETPEHDWFYYLEDWGAPTLAWDWREYCTPYGPFGSLELAQQHLRDNHANPGGAMIRRHPAKLDDLDLALINLAKT